MVELTLGWVVVGRGLGEMGVGWVERGGMEEVGWGWEDWGLVGRGCEWMGRLLMILMSSTTTSEERLCQRYCSCAKVRGNRLKHLN